MNWFIVICSDTGEAYSIGTVIADPLPPEYVAVPLSDEDAERLNTGIAIWDAATRSLVDNPNWTPPLG